MLLFILTLLFVIIIIVIGNNINRCGLVVGVYWYIGGYAGVVILQDIIQYYYYNYLN